MTETGNAGAESVECRNDLASMKTSAGNVSLRDDRSGSPYMIRVFTDGSCHNASGTGGWAALVLMNGKEIALSGQASGTTHQRMELTAAIESLRYLREAGAGRAEILVCTDSQYLADLPDRRKKLIAMGMLTKNKIQVRNSDLLLEIFDLINEFRVSFLKVRSHEKKNEGNPYNRQVDQRSRKIVRDIVRKAGEDIR